MIRYLYRIQSAVRKHLNVNLFLGREERMLMYKKVEE